MVALENMAGGGGLKNKKKQNKNQAMVTINCATFPFNRLKLHKKQEIVQ